MKRVERVLGRLDRRPRAITAIMNQTSLHLVGDDGSAMAHIVFDKNELMGFRIERAKRK